MTDDHSDRTRRRRPPPGLRMTADDRALVGQAQRRQTRTNPRGVVIRDAFDDEEIEDTSPQEMLEREPTEEDLEIIHSLGRDPLAPVTNLDLVKLLRSELRRHKEHRSGNRQLEKRLVELFDRPPHPETAELQKDVRSMADRVVELETDNKESKRKLKFAKGIAITAISAALASFGGWAEKYWSRAQAEASAAVKAERMADDIQGTQRAMKDYVENIQRQINEVRNDLREVDRAWRAKP